MFDSKLLHDVETPFFEQVIEVGSFKIYPIVTFDLIGELIHTVTVSQTGALALGSMSSEYYSVATVTQSEVSLSVKLITDVYAGTYNYLLGFSYEEVHRFAELLRHRVGELILGNLIV